MIKLLNVKNEVTKEEGALYIGAYIYDRKSLEERGETLESANRGLVFWFKDSSNNIKYIKSFVVTPKEWELFRTGEISDIVDIGYYLHAQNGSLIILDTGSHNTHEGRYKNEQYEVIKVAKYDFSLEGEWYDSASELIRIVNKYKITGIIYAIKVAMTNPEDEDFIVPSIIRNEDKAIEINFNKKVLDI